ncbi:MAG: DUF2804 domain-containing protein [Treponema sp.]|nr:DUF2804 domain-containing protein [Treponema sp.]
MEITSTVPALDELGRPINFGWSRNPCFLFESGLLRSPKRRITQSDRYILISPAYQVLIEILDDGYLGYFCLSIVSMKDKKRNSQTIMKAFPMGSFNLPNDSEEGSIKFNRKESAITFASREGGVRIIKADIPGFGKKRGLTGQVVLTPLPEAQSLITHMPWRGKRDAFFYSRRSPCYSAEGVILFGNMEIVFTMGEGWGIFDWTRGVRPRSDLGFWAASCAGIGDRVAGFSVGYNSADSGEGTDNAFFLDGKLHKLDQVSFHIPSGPNLPWRFTSNNNRLEMSFTPHQERDENHQILFYSLKRRQLFGTFSGKVILDDGMEFCFNDMPGITERRKSRL